MNKEQVEEFINDMSSLLRNLKLNSFFDIDNKMIEISYPKKPFLYFLDKKYKKMDELIKMGGVIVGSRALKYYKINGIPILNRQPDDFDIVLDKNAFFKFCNKYKLNNLVYDKNRISVNYNTGLFICRDGYGGDISFFKHEFDIICKDDLPSHHICNGCKISTIESILHEKLKIIKDDAIHLNKLSNYNSKHMTDCIEIMVKIKAHSSLLDSARYAANTPDEKSSLLPLLADILKISKPELKS